MNNRRAVIGHLLMTAVAVTACSGRESVPARESARAAAPPVAPRSRTILVDSAHPPAIAGQEGWNYVQTATADLDGDGRAERVVLTARVEMMKGRPLWDDGQPWQLYIESPDSQRTRMYARYVQLGTLTMRLTQPDSGARPRVVILEHLPDRLAIYEGEYHGVGKLVVTAPYEQMVDPRGETASPSLP